VIDSLEGFT